MTYYVDRLSMKEVLFNFFIVWNSGSLFGSSIREIYQLNWNDQNMSMKYQSLRKYFGILI